MARQVIFATRPFCFLGVLFVATGASAQSTGDNSGWSNPGDTSGSPASVPESPPPPAERPESARSAFQWEVTPAASGSVYSIQPFSTPGIPESARGNGEGGSLGVTGYLAPVLDDDAPRTLQPYLQRASLITGALGVAGFATSYNGGPVQSSDLNANLSGSVNAYLTPFFALTGGLGYTIDNESYGSAVLTNSLTARAGFGLRFGDTRFDLSYSFQAQYSAGRFWPIQWGLITVSAQSVLARRLSLSVNASAFDGGESAGGSVEYFVTKDLGIFINGFLSDVVVVFINGPDGVSESVGSGLGYWVLPNVVVVPSYALTHTSLPAQPTLTGYTEWTNGFGLYVTVRM